jgi:hypothetical protein
VPEVTSEAVLRLIPGTEIADSGQERAADGDLVQLGQPRFGRAGGDPLTSPGQHDPVYGRVDEQDGIRSTADAEPVSPTATTTGTTQTPTPSRVPKVPASDWPT